MKPNKRNNFARISAIVIVVILILSLIGAYTMSFASAVQLAPENNQLQPIPENTEPNVSGNINSINNPNVISEDGESVTTQAETQDQIPAQSENEVLTDEVPQNTDTESLGLNYKLIIIVIVVLGLGYGFYYLTKKTKSDQ